jgi:hypothetical protein
MDVDFMNAYKYGLVMFLTGGLVGIAATLFAVVLLMDCGAQ